MKSAIIHTRLGKIEYSSLGEGTPVICIHGGHSNCHDTMCHKGFDLNRFNLITPSRPGYGKTPLGNNKTARQAADLIMEMIKTLGLDKVILYGISAGGLTAIELAANYPHKVEKLVLASAISKKWLTKGEKTYRVAHIIFRPGVERFTWAMVRFFFRIMPGILAKSFHREFSTRLISTLNKEDIGSLARALSQYSSGEGFLNDVHQDISPETIQRIQCPTLIVHSKNDKSVDFGHSLHAQQEIPGANHVALDNDWGHLFWLGDDSRESVKKIIAFLDE